MNPRRILDLASIPHWREAVSAVEGAGWPLIGTGDWAWVYGEARERLAWRVSPFDPAYDYFASVCTENPNPHLPRIVGHHNHPEGGSSVVMELLDAVPEPTATDWVATFDSEPDAATASMLQVLHAAVDECTLPLFMGLDVNPGNVKRRGTSGELVLIDAFWVNGLALFEMVVADPQRAVDLFGRRELLDWAQIPAMDAAGAASVTQALASLR